MNASCPQHPHLKICQPCMSFDSVMFMFLCALFQNKIPPLVLQSSSNYVNLFFLGVFKTCSTTPKYYPDHAITLYVI